MLNHTPLLSRQIRRTKAARASSDSSFTMAGIGYLAAAAIVLFLGLLASSL
jgi:hypothetical protein